MTKLAFIGLGKMGAPMAANLVKAGFTVIGFDLLDELLTASGIPGAGSVADAADDADAVITMLPSGAAVLSVTQEVLANRKGELLLVDCSSIDIDTARQVHHLAQAAGALSLDAPVSGGTQGAIAGTLTIMCGGSDEAYAIARPILEPMARKTVHCGAAGTGQAAKICNNMILGAIMGVTAEAFNLADKLGLSGQTLFDIVSTSSGSSSVLLKNCPVPGVVPTSAASNGYQPGFASSLMLKDLKLSQAAAASAGVNTPLGAQATALYQGLNDAGLGADDFSAVIRYLRD